MMRKIITINPETCNGCGLCAEACHEGAIGMKNGKAVLLRDDYCDGLGDCLPVCPTGAIAFEQREAAEYDAVAVKARMDKQHGRATTSCPGAMAHTLQHTPPTGPGQLDTAAPGASQLRQWPVQIQLAPVNAPYFDGANLLISADCAAYACADFHGRFMADRITLIGCPKLDSPDGGDYSEKLTAILTGNSIVSITVARMEVPCCGGIEHAVRIALQRSGKQIPLRVVTISTTGDTLGEG